MPRRALPITEPMACTRCGEVKPLAAFPLYGRGRTVSHRCRACWQAYEREHRQEHLEQEHVNDRRHNAARQADPERRAQNLDWQRHRRQQYPEVYRERERRYEREKRLADA